MCRTRRWRRPARWSTRGGRLCQTRRRQYIARVVALAPRYRGSHPGLERPPLAKNSSTARIRSQLNISRYEWAVASLPSPKQHRQLNARSLVVEIRREGGREGRHGEPPTYGAFVVLLNASTFFRLSVVRLRNCVDTSHQRPSDAGADHQPLTRKQPGASVPTIVALPLLGRSPRRQDGCATHFGFFSLGCRSFQRRSGIAWTT